MNTLALSNFVTIIQNNSNTFYPEEIVNICKRENNSKRDFLFVNSLQGKHLHVNPKKTLALYDELVAKINSSLDLSEIVTVIGFAETATAIGHYIASKIANSNVTYMQTTREDIPNLLPLLTFKEEHSHAPDQYLYGDISILRNSTKVIFVDDEISTGNTILNFIKAIEEKLDLHLNYGVASLLNFQNEEWQNKFSQKGIDTYCILKGKIKNLNSKVNIPICDEVHFSQTYKYLPVIFVINQDITSFKKERIGEKPTPFCEFSKELFSKFKMNLKNELPNKGEDVLVLGTEEYMYTPLVLANCFNQYLGTNAEFHATTRSPIAPSDSTNYAIQKRYPITSCYDCNRQTYVYNLKKYDKVYIVTDKTPTCEFVIDIQTALANEGCDVKNIYFVVMDCF